MNDTEKYLFDLTGYLKIPGVLRGADLDHAQDTAQRYIDTPRSEVPDGFEINLEREHFDWYHHAFAFDKALNNFVLVTFLQCDPMPGILVLAQLP